MTKRRQLIEKAIREAFNAYGLRAAWELVDTIADKIEMIDGEKANETKP